jgi:hypothetical protein
MDAAAIATGMTFAKAGIDTLRTAFGLVKDVQQAFTIGRKEGYRRQDIGRGG